MPRLSGLFLALLLLAPAAQAQPFDLQVTLDAPDEVRPGEPFTMRSTVTNAGPGGVSDVNIQFGATGYDPRCIEGLRIDVLEPGESRAFECTITPRTPPYLILTYMQASTPHQEADRSNNAATKTVKILTPPELVLHPNPGTLAKPGLPVSLVINYANRAAYPATGVTLTVDAPSGIVRAPEQCTVTGTRAVCTLGTIAPGPISTAIIIELAAPDISEHTFTATATIAASEGDDVPENNTVVFPLRTYRTFFVTSTADSGSGSLRAALDGLNAGCDESYPCLVAFRIPPGTRQWQTINIASPLPVITAHGFPQIDGTTQREYFGDTNPRGPEIEITGSDSAGNGLENVRPSYAAVRGLAINNFPGSAILLRHQAGVSETFLGTDPTGTRAVPNGRGIVVSGASAVRITKNVISGNRRSGIFVERGSAVEITENVIGLDAAVTAPLGNGASGIYLSTTANDAVIKDNHIGFNAHFGIALDALTPRTRMFHNSFQANGQTAIDYGLDALPAEVPEITSVRFEGGATIVEGVSTNRGNFGVDVTVFANDAPDPSGFGEGQYLLGTVSAASGSFVFRYPGDLRGKWITAVQTRIDVPLDLAQFTTSEFSRAVEAR